MLRWKSFNNKNILTYEVWFSKNNKEWEKINQVNFIDNGFLWSANESVKGYYKVRAINYQNRVSSFSNTVYIP